MSAIAVVCEAALSSTGCSQGTSCPFLHPDDSQLTHPAPRQLDEQQQQQGHEGTQAPSSLTAAAKDTADALRVTPSSQLLDKELAYIVRQFGSSAVIDKAATSSSSPGYTVAIDFVPSDPEWPAFLGMTAVGIQLSLPLSYPTTTPLSFHITDTRMPPLIGKLIEAAAAEHIRLGFRAGQPFAKSLFKWFDVNVEQLFIAAAIQVR